MKLPEIFLPVPVDPLFPFCLGKLRQVLFFFYERSHIQAFGLLNSTFKVVVEGEVTMNISQLSSVSILKSGSNYHQVNFPREPKRFGEKELALQSCSGEGPPRWLNTTGRVVSSWGDCRSKIQESAKPWAGSLQAFSSLGQPRRSLAGSWIASVSASIFPRHSLVCLCLQLPFSPSYKGPGPVGARRTLKTSFQLDHTHRDPTSKESHREK